MKTCKLCGKNRPLVVHNPYYGILAIKGRRKVKICRACHLILEHNSTKAFTNVLQCDVWDKKVDNAIDAMIKPVRRLNYMIRYAGEVTANPESLAEHSYFVLLFATQIAKTIIDVPVDFEKLVSIGMFHDSPEIMLGDIPTPLKGRVVKKENDSLEKLALGKLTDEWKLWTGHLNEYDYKDVNNIESRIVKCADYISAIVYCTEEVYIGSHNLEGALQRSLQKFSQFAHHDWEKALVAKMFGYVMEQTGAV